METTTSGDGTIVAEDEANETKGEDTPHKAPKKIIDPELGELTPAENEEMELAKQRGASAFRVWKRNFIKQKKLAEEAAKKAKAAEIERKREEAKRDRELAWEKKKAEEAARIAYIDSRTKRYVNGGGLYFGDFSNGQDKFWGVPEGNEGEYTRNTGDTMYDGQWMDGKMAGRGRYYFGAPQNEGDMWDGTFVENELHGLGTYHYNYQRIDPATGKKGRPPREAIYFKSRRVCFVDELCRGRHIRLETGVRPNHRIVSATILARHKENPRKWQLKYQHDHGDCIRWIDLSQRRFEVLSKMPKSWRMCPDPRTDDCRKPTPSSNYAPWRFEAAQKKIFEMKFGLKKQGNDELGRDK